MGTEWPCGSMINETPRPTHTYAPHLPTPLSSYYMPDSGNSQRQKGWCRKVKARTTNVGWDVKQWRILCPEYDKLRKEARKDVVKKTQMHIQTSEIEKIRMTGLLIKAKSLFINCSFTWPLHYTFYYLGHVPFLDPHIPLDTFKN
jgi:hypothetical protein